MIVTFEVAQAIEEVSQQQQPATDHHHEYQCQRNVEVGVKLAIGIHIAAISGAHRDHFQEDTSQKESHQNQHEDKNSGNVNQGGEGVVMAFAQIQELGINGQQARLEDPGAEPLRRQRQKVAHGVGIE